MTGTASHDPFTVLNSTDSSVLFSIMKDLELNCEDFEEQIDAFRAEELARAAIAKSQYKAFLQKQSDKERT